jgi:hypothetical protein
MNEESLDGAGVKAVTIAKALKNARAAPIIGFGRRKELATCLIQTQLMPFQLDEALELTPAQLLLFMQLTY